MKVEFITVEEMQSVVEAYIYEKKGISVKIDIQNTLNPFVLGNQLDKLHYAYNVALEYFKHKK